MGIVILQCHNKYKNKDKDLSTRVYRCYNDLQALKNSFYALSYWNLNGSLHAHLYYRCDECVLFTIYIRYVCTKHGTKYIWKYLSKVQVLWNFVKYKYKYSKWKS